MTLVDKRIRILLSAGVVLGLLLVAAAPSPVPPFPFQNTQQLGPGIPGLAPYGEPEIATCPNGTPLVIFALGTYTASEGAHGWMVWVELRGNHFTGAFFDGGTSPTAVYQGTTNDANGHMTLLRSEAFNPQIHQNPCDGW